MNPVVNELMARQRVAEAVRAAQMQQRWASLFGADPSTHEQTPSHRGPARPARRALLRLIGAGASLTI